MILTKSPCFLLFFLFLSDISFHFFFNFAINLTIMGSHLCSLFAKFCQVSATSSPPATSLAERAELVLPDIYTHCTTHYLWLLHICFCSLLFAQSCLIINIRKSYQYKTIPHRYSNPGVRIQSLVDLPLDHIELHLWQRF